MRTLKVRERHVDFDSNGLVMLKYSKAKTVIKHNYTKVQLDGVVYSVSIGNKPFKGGLTSVYIDGFYL